MLAVVWKLAFFSVLLLICLLCHWLASRVVGVSSSEWLSMAEDLKRTVLLEQSVERAAVRQKVC
jgi:hypothetical protein